VCDIQHKEPPKRRDRKSDRRSHTHTRIRLTQKINLRSAACGQHSTALFFFGLQTDNQQKQYGSPA